MGLKDSKNNSIFLPSQKSDPNPRVGENKGSNLRGNGRLVSISPILCVRGSILVDLHYLDSFISDNGFKEFLNDYFNLSSKISVILKSQKSFDSIKFRIVSVDLDYINVSILKPVKSRKSISWSQFFGYYSDSDLRSLIPVLKNNRGHLSFIDKDSETLRGLPDSFFGSGGASNV